MADAAPGLSPRSSKERSASLPLTLITLAGEEVPIVVDPNVHARLHDFQNAVLEELPY